jgi:excisionase family DNA binding protein
MTRHAQEVGGQARGVAERGLVDEVSTGRLLTASDLATLCEVDLKTIHNWVDRGRIAHFRTPGRHLRFRAVDAAEFLRACGFTIPRELERASSPTTLVVGNEETAAHVRRAVGERLRVRHATHAYDALVLAGWLPADVYVMDVLEVAEDIDVNAMLAALHRASPRAVFVALVDEPVGLPGHCSRVRRDDGAALGALLGSLCLAPADEVAARRSPARRGMLWG